MTTELQMQSSNQRPPQRIMAMTPQQHQIHMQQQQQRHMTNMQIQQNSKQIRMPGQSQGISQQQGE